MKNYNKQNKLKKRNLKKINICILIAVCFYLVLVVGFSMHSDVLTMQGTADIGGFSITYILNGGTNEANAIDYYFATTNALLPTPTYEGYTFLGWYDNAMFNGNKLTRTPVNEDVRDLVLYARWETTPYYIQYELDGGTQNPNQIEIFAQSDLPITLLEPTKLGYIFDGWYEEADFSGNRVTTITQEADITLYAKWLEDKTSVKFVFGDNIYFDGSSYLNTDIPLFSVANKNRDFEMTVNIDNTTFLGGQTGGYNTVFNCAEHKTAPYPGFFVRRTNNQFYMKATCTTSNYLENNYNIGDLQSVYVKRKDNILYAKVNNGNLAQMCDYSNLLVSFNYPLLFGADLNGDSKPFRFFKGTLSNMTVTNKYEDNETTITLPTPTLTGLRFKGWYSDAQFTNKIGDGGDTFNLRNITLYAKWEGDTYYIRFNANGGTGTMQDMPIQVGESKQLTLNAFTKEDYSFIGWNTAANGSGTSYKNGQTVGNLSNVDGDIVNLYAQWSTYAYYADRLVFDGTANTLEDTGVYLYNSQNVNKNFRISFTIDNYGTNSNNATLLNSKLESGNYSGLALRLEGSNDSSSKLALKIRDSHSDNFTRNYNKTTGLDVEIIRENGVIYTRIGRDIYDPIYTYGNTIDTFDIPLTFGGNINELGQYDRFFNGTISDVTVEFYQNSRINTALYAHTETRQSDLYKMDGSIYFDGYNYIDTGINLFSSQNINKDFEITFSIDYVEKNEGQATIVNGKDETRSDYAGFAYRISSTTTNNEMSVRWPGRSNVSKSDTVAAPKTVKISRRSGILYYKIGDNSEVKLMDMTNGLTTGTFSPNLTFGASLNNSGNPFRYFVGLVSNINVQLYDN